MKLIKFLLIGVIVTAALTIITNSKIVLFIHAGLATVYGGIAAVAIFKGLWQESKKELQQLKQIAANESSE